MAGDESLWTLDAENVGFWRHFSLREMHAVIVERFIEKESAAAAAAGGCNQMASESERKFFFFRDTKEESSQTLDHDTDYMNWTFFFFSGSF